MSPYPAGPPITGGHPPAAGPATVNTGEVARASYRCSPVRVLAAKDLRPGLFVWPNGAEQVRVAAVLPTAGAGVTVITESGAGFGWFTSATADAYRTRSGRPGTWVITARLVNSIMHWHRAHEARCCGIDGPWCCASITHAYRRLLHDDIWQRS